MNPNALQVNIRMGPATRDKLDALKTQYGSRSQVVAVAIDRLHRDELMASDLEDAQRKMAEDADNA